ncbi:MAG: hypothetical protein AAF602_33285, partial [Myxococcota bacterium]
ETTMPNEPSFLQVDTWVLRRDAERLAALGDDPAWQDHLREVQRELVVPAWARALEDRAGADRTPSPRRRPWWWAVGLALVAVLAAIVLWPRPSYVGVRGELGVTVYFEQGVWDGSPIAVGTPFRLELQGPRAPFYAVLLEERGETTRLSAGPWPADGVVPGAWAFDAPPGPDATLVVLTLTRDPRGLSVDQLVERARASHREPLVERGSP